MSAQLSIIPFVSKSKEDLEQIGQFVAKQDVDRHPHSKKRPIGSLHYRTRSFKSYKLPRRLKRGSLLKQRIAKKKEQVSDVGQRCRKERRRPRTFAAQLGKLHSYDITHWDSKSPSPKSLRLATHVWHRKRFIVANRSGVMTAMRSSYHGFKAIDAYCKRGKTFVHDQSYLLPLELSCTMEDFLAIFEHIVVCLVTCGNHGATTVALLTVPLHRFSVSGYWKQHLSTMDNLQAIRRNRVYCLDSLYGSVPNGLCWSCASNNSIVSACDKC
jgi:hypothetical protein